MLGELHQSRHDNLVVLLENLALVEQVDQSSRLVLRKEDDFVVRVVHLFFEKIDNFCRSLHCKFFEFFMGAIEVVFTGRLLPNLCNLAILLFLTLFLFFFDFLFVSYDLLSL